MRRLIGHVGAAAFGAGLAWAGLFASEMLADTRPADYRDLPTEGRASAFQRRMVERFPPGTPEATLIAHLSQQGFQLVETDRELSATYFAGSIVCSEYFGVDWTAANGLIETVETSYHLSCL